MSEKNKHIEMNAELPKRVQEMIASTHVDWGKSREQVWTEFEKKLVSRQPAETRIIRAGWMRSAYAAAAAIIIGFAVVAQFYTRTIVVPTGEHRSYTLPDGSKARLNAQSTLAYKPLTWKISRKVKFEGEAFFEVQPGRKFEVSSGSGITTVLGTSFNIYSRNKDYQVICITGNVKVSDRSKKNEVVLKPEQKAVISKGGKIDVLQEINKDQSLSWLDNRLSFTSAPLDKVFEEISRQYGVSIIIPVDLDKTYTGSFKTTVPLDNTLTLVCKPFNLNYTLSSENEYTVSGIE